MAKSFYALGGHLASGQLNFQTDKITCAAVTTDIRSQLATLRAGPRVLSEFYSAWLAYQITPVTVTPTVSTVNPVDDPDVDEAVTRVVVPDISLINTFPGTVTVYALIFYVDSGTPSTSPLLGYDDVGPLSMTENFTYVYKSSPDGLVQITLP